MMVLSLIFKVMAVKKYKMDVKNNMAVKYGCEI